ncbi:MAG TPA: RNA polymerase sigma-70 factor [Pantanalinema sp.]
MTPVVEQWYTRYKPMMFSLAYRMLGQVTDAEDIVHDVFAQLYRETPSDVRQPKAYLCKITTNRCLDLLKSARKQREAYVGPWLPEPLLTEAEDPALHVLKDEGVSYALLALMESLAPVERAVFILRVAFEFDYAFIGDLVQKSEDNCRKILSRVKKKLAGQHPAAPPASPAADDALIRQFLHASRTGDMAQILHLLAEDATLYSDGGGKNRSAIRPIISRGYVARFLAWIASQYTGEGAISLRSIHVNGQQGLLVLENGHPQTVFAFDVQAGQVRSIFVVRNPDKLRHLSRG